MFKEQVEKNFSSIFTEEVLSVLQQGIARGVAICRDNQKAQRDRLGYYAHNSEARDVFSALCKGLEEVLHEKHSLLFQSQQLRATSSYYIEVFNADLVLHLRKASPDLPQYMKEKCKLNTSFGCGKQNYCVIEFCEKEGSAPIENVHIVVYNPKGQKAFARKLEILSENQQIA